MMRGIIAAVIALACGCAQIWGIKNTSAKCTIDQITCNDACVDPLSDHDNCGGCDKPCGAMDVCGNGQCGAACPIDQMLCDSTCIDPLSDAMNCNGCGMACAAGDVCVFGECQPPCDTTALNAIIVDPWGVSWDGLERTPAPLDAAQVACKAFGARLPTATELYRVAANQSGAVGMSFQTNPLWTVTAVDMLDQATIRLSDGAFTSVPAATASAFRCVCPEPLPRTFTSDHCNGDPKAGCFEVNGYNVDVKDRPALPKASAISECIADRAHIVDAPLLAEAIRAGLPGQNTAVMTGDQWYYFESTQLVWNGVATTWEPPGFTAVDNRTAAPFRCAAIKAAQSPNPNTIANVFYPKVSKYAGETMDQTAADWAAAHDACFARGGHLPRSAELAELILEGLPNGSNAQLWTSDETGYNTVQFLVEVNNWSGLDQRYNDAYTGGAGQTLTWDYKTNTHPFRCIWYPLDPMYTAPTSCNGGCFEVDLPGNSVAKMWFDSMDRPASLPGAAFGDCEASGGHLASERDLTEAIRAGLPNGTAAMTPPYVWTSDIAQGNFTVVFWTDVATGFTDEYSSYMTWSGPTATYRYRCMWTNELR
jgi:hypothetical protein